MCSIAEKLLNCTTPCFEILTEIGYKMAKHAYLIMAHSNINQLKKLLYCLDYEDNDIFVHFDAKFKELDIEDFKFVCKKSNLIFTNRISVYWGGYSLVKARFILLETAYANGPYDFYHFISGQDLPLYSQTYIHRFFDKHKDEEFISIGQYSEWYLKRIKYFYFCDNRWRRKFIGKYINKLLILVQKMLCINRIRHSNIKFYNGEEWFSVTEQFVEYVLTKRDFCEKYFRYGDCTDELIFATLYMLNPDVKRRYISPYKHELFDNERMDVVRAIDWQRGCPYIYRLEDYQMLKESNCLFARKFDENVDKEIIDKLVADVR